MKFSEKLFGITHIGTPVILSGSHSDPYELIHPGMVLGDYAEHEFEDAVDHPKGKKHPKDWSDEESFPITTVIVSSADLEIELMENGKIVKKDKLTIKGPPVLGEHVFHLQGTHEGQSGLAWHGISHHADPAFPEDPEENLINRISAGPAFMTEMKNHMHPGMVMVVTDLPTNPQTRSGEDFVIITTGV